jgi:hypothetical protein
MKLALPLVLLLGCTEHGQTPPGGGDANNDGGGSGSGSGSGSGGLVCNDDGAFEPNDTIESAFVTPVASQSQSFSAIAAICATSNDTDHYKIDVGANSAVEVVASWESGSPVNVSLLNAAGSSVANGAPLGSTTMRLCVSNLPAGTFFASVFASAPNNYRLSIQIVPSC